MLGLNQSNHTMSDLIRLMEFRAAYNIDIIMVVHKPKAILEGISGYFSHIYIFYIKSRLEDFEKKVDDYEECKTAGQFLKDYVRAFPSIIEESSQFYDNSGQGDHRFPHVIVDTTTGRLTPQFIDEEWMKNKLTGPTPSSEN